MTATSSIPIVLFGNFDPVALGLVKSLGRPGGNVTGVCDRPRRHAGRQEARTAARGGAARHRIGMLSPDDPAMRQQVAEVAAGCGGTRPHRGSGRGRERRLRARVRRAGGRAGCRRCSSPPRPISCATAKEIIERAARFRLPAIYEWREHVEDGGLMTYATSLPALHKRIAEYIDRILEGAKPGEMPIEQPSKFDLVINLKTAKALGLALPPSLLLRAEVIE
jgi:putative ABC transport system substrate-binding protein